ncbi:2-oxoacid ferredoxin oxidoreductase [Clostridia bacterium]|nr:2-oxoacid ferredoxin oxidoreductase [Clostridia bacterium]
MGKYHYDENIAWCPGCGDFGIRNALIKALESLDLDPHQLVITSGIGQAAKMPQYIQTNYFNGLHGRALPLAAAIKSVNPRLTVIAEGGDGDMYGEGGNHFLHNIRRNIDITHIVHNNMVYGLTKGQASPTSQLGYKTPLQVDGVISEPFNPLLIALSMGATFVARCFSSNEEHCAKIIEQAILHKGYALVDIFQPCVSFNKVNTFAWYKENTYYLDEKDPTDSIEMAFNKAQESSPFPLGILYQKKGKKTYEENCAVYKISDQPIITRKRDLSAVQKLIDHK